MKKFLNEFNELKELEIDDKVDFGSKKKNIYLLQTKYETYWIIFKNHKYNKKWEYLIGY